MSTQTEETTMETEEIERQEIEDDLRCGECGSTEMGNCQWCKVD